MGWLGGVAVAAVDKVLNFGFQIHPRGSVGRDTVGTRSRYIAAVLVDGDVEDEFIHGERVRSGGRGFKHGLQALRHAAGEAGSMPEPLSPRNDI